MTITWTADEWNDVHPVGTSVDYAPVKGMLGAERSVTRSPAWRVGLDHDVVLVEGHVEGVALDHLSVVTFKSTHTNGSWVACATREGAEAHQRLFLPEARGGVEQASCPSGTSWSREGGLVSSDGEQFDPNGPQRGKALVL